MTKNKNLWVYKLQSRFRSKTAQQEHQHSVNEAKQSRFASWLKPQLALVQEGDPPRPYRLDAMLPIWLVLSVLLVLTIHQSALRWHFRSGKCVNSAALPYDLASACWKKPESIYFCFIGIISCKYHGKTGDRSIPDPSLTPMKAYKFETFFANL